MTADILEYVTQGEVRAIPVPVTSTDLTLLTGDGFLCGWSLREASGDISAYNEGSVVAPAAGATIVTLTGIPAGTYTVEIVTSLQGAAAAGDANNFKLTPSTGNAVVLPNPGAAGNFPQEEIQVTLGAAGTLTITAVAIGTAGVTYSATISITPINVPTAVIEFQDGNNPIGESEMTVAGVDTQWFGNYGMLIYNQIKLHVVSGTVTGAVYARFSRCI